jgi:hypothetical protein
MEGAMGEWSDAIEEGYIDPMTHTLTDHPCNRSDIARTTHRRPQPMKKSRPQPKR